jgi:SAM-dependent methyltransferase
LGKIFNIAPNRQAVHPFDFKHGTDTGGYLGPHEIRSGGIHDAMNNGYSAVAPSVFREVCRRWRATLSPSAAQVEAYSFVDVGAGKGRALLLAAELPFRKVIGVELSEELAGIAKRNIALWKRVARPRTKIRIMHEDALGFRWPRTPLLVYLNNPFDCALVERLAWRLAAAAVSGPGLIDILYLNPACTDALVQRGFFKLLWDALIQMGDADQQADPYGATSDRISALRFCAKSS